MNERNNLQHVQKPKSSLMTILAILITALIVGGGTYAWQQSELKIIKATLEQQITSLQNQIDQASKQDSDQKASNPQTPEKTIPVASGNSNGSGVIISTDKAKYNKGETIKIAVNNKLDTLILYSGGGDRFWSVEYFKDNKWTDSDNEEDGGFQLTEKNIGDACSIALYERTSPIELKTELSLFGVWNQKICPFESMSPDKPRIVRYIESGQYRLAFIYGSGISESDHYRLSGSKTVYSNSFIIE